jgi:hypothetical protein
METRVTPISLAADRFFDPDPAARSVAVELYNDAADSHSNFGSPPFLYGMMSGGALRPTGWGLVMRHILEANRR